MTHQNGRKKLNLKEPHRRAMLRNQAIQLIMLGHVVTTKARAKQTQRLAEKLVTVARVGNEFNARRRALSMLPYKKEALLKLFNEVAPKYVNRPGGYTRIIPMGKRTSDMATIARLEWI